MFGGEDNATKEDWELEHYGLTEEQTSCSEGSDAEDALYRQIHYNADSNDTFQTEDAQTIPNSALAEGGFSNLAGYAKSNDVLHKQTSLTVSNKKPTPFPENSAGKGTRNSLTLKSRRQEEEIVLVEDGGFNVNDVIVASDDDDGRMQDEGEKRDSKYRVDKKRKGNIQASTLSRRKTLKGDEIIQIHDSDSDVVLEVISARTQVDSSVKRASRKRSIKEVPDTTRPIKMNRRSVSLVGSKDDNQSTKSVTSRKMKVTIATGKKNTPVTSLSKPKPEKGGSQFFIDSIGMVLDDVRKEKVDAQSEWKEEKKKTKAMLKEKSFVEVLGSSDEDDCIAIESCSDEEGLQVHFDLKKDHSLPLDDTQTKKGKWSVAGKRRADYQPRPDRYFIQSQQKHVKCYNCFEMGHTKADCPKPPHVPACILCGTRGHTDRECPHALCFRCSLPGHHSKSCPTSRSIRYAKCSRCQMTGHAKKTCPDLWRQYHLTTQRGPIVNANNKHFPNRQRDLYCSNCSKKGHKYYDCPSTGFDEFVVFSYDEVCQYDARPDKHQRYPEIGGNDAELGISSLDIDGGPSARYDYRTFIKRMCPFEKDEGVKRTTTSSETPEKKIKKIKDETKQDETRQKGFQQFAVADAKSKAAHSGKNYETPRQSWKERKNADRQTKGPSVLRNEKRDLTREERRKEKKKAKKELRKMQKQQDTSKAQQMDRREPPHANVRNDWVPQKPSSRGFVLNTKLMDSAHHPGHYHGNHRTSSAAGSWDVDFPRSSAPVDADYGQGSRTGKWKKKGARLREKIQDKLSDLGEKFGGRRREGKRSWSGAGKPWDKQKGQSGSWNSQVDYNGQPYSDGFGHESFAGNSKSSKWRRKKNKKKGQ